MINEELLSYTRGQLKAGASREDIKKALATGGWSEQDVKEAFDAIDGVMVPPVPVAPRSPTPTAPAAVRSTTPIGIGEAARMAQSGTTGSVRPQPIMPRLEIDTRPVVAPNTARIAAMPAPQTKRQVPWLFISVLIVILALAAFGYWFYPQLAVGVDRVLNTFFPVPTENALPADFPIEEVIPNGTTTATTNLTLASSVYVTPKGTPTLRPPQNWTSTVFLDGILGGTIVTFKNPIDSANSLGVTINTKSSNYTTDSDIKSTTASITLEGGQVLSTTKTANGYIIDAKYQSTNRHNKFVMIETASKLYFIGGSSLESDWNTFSPLFDQAVATLQINQ